MPRAYVSLSACLVAIIGLLLVASPLPPAQAQLEDLVARVKPAVVVVRVQHVLGGGGHGTGFIYDRSGYILTNQHVVEGAKTITVILPDKRTFPATVVDYVRHQEMACPPRVESWIDAAVLKIEAADLPTVPLGDSATLRQGQEILVMGYPGGVSTEEVSVTRGIIGAVRNGWFQTDAIMMPGNSGGPALDREGRAIGLATFGTGFQSRIGGIVAMHAARPVAQGALVPDGPRLRELRVSGIGYIPPLMVGLKVVARMTAQEGNRAPTQSQLTSEIVQADRFAGGVLFTERMDDRREIQGYLGADGVYTVASTGPTWKIVFPEPYQRMPFPPCLNMAWKDQARMEFTDGSIAVLAGPTKVEAVGETVAVPAGTFDRVLRIHSAYDVTVTRKSGSGTYRDTITRWWAPGMGQVKMVEETSLAQRWTTEMISLTVPPSGP